jgi:hypothetical protein
MRYNGVAITVRGNVDEAAGATVNLSGEAV